VCTTPTDRTLARPGPLFFFFVLFFFLCFRKAYGFSRHFWVDQKTSQSAKLSALRSRTTAGYTGCRALRPPCRRVPDAARTDKTPWGKKKERAPFRTGCTGGSAFIGRSFLRGIRPERNLGHGRTTYVVDLRQTRHAAPHFHARRSRRGENPEIKTISRTREVFVAYHQL